LVELLLPLLFVLSYVYWPFTFQGRYLEMFVVWLILLVGFLALAVYDLRWMLLPNRLVYPLLALAVGQAIVLSTVFHGGLSGLVATTWSVLIDGGLFYLIFQLSDGRWIGGGDVKLGALLGVVVGGPTAALLLLFIASLAGTVVAVPLLLSGRATRTSRLPFGPFLLLGAFVTYLFGAALIAWYKRLFLLT
jgi:leader peptidase (prepilin peptidase)/N-methyltransferase